MTSILIVEDDADIGALVARYLTKAGFEVERVTDGRTALSRIAAASPAALVLDVMLPGLDGLEICRRMRADSRTAAIPIIMLTARGDEADRIAGLELGADDYVAKPFSPGELVARVRAVLRRAARPDESGAGITTISYGPLVIDRDRHLVTADGQEVSLTAKEFLLLEYLLTHRGRVLSRDVLLTDVWGYGYTGGTRTVDVHVRRLREKIPFLVERLVTVKQFGYKLLDRPASA
ncbi:MAG TPA: response regulator transcription factor [Vicinamibacterales bacterium]|jgi:DNA-binding response OmpR family regulator